MAGDIGKALLAPVRHAVLNFVDAEHVALAHEIGTHSIPIGAELFNYRIDWNAAPLVQSADPLEIRPHHRMRKRPDCRNEMFDYASKFLSVLLAVIYYRLVLFGAERWALQDPIAHLDLMRGIDPVFAEVLQCAVETVETLFAVTAFDAAVVGVVAKFEIRIEGANRSPPTACEMNAVFGRIIERDEQCVSVKPIRRKWAKLIRVNADGSARSHLQRNEAVRSDQITLPASVG